MMQEIELVIKIAHKNSILDIQRNGRYYQNRALDFSVWDHVFAFTELCIYGIYFWTLLVRPWPSLARYLHAWPPPCGG